MKNHYTYYILVTAAAFIGHFIAYKLVHIPQQLEFVIILSLLLFYPILRKPIIGLYVIFILSPFIPAIRRLYYLFHDRPTIDPLIIIGDLCLFFILLGLFFEFKEDRVRYQGVNAYIRIIVIYFVYLIIRSFFFNILPLTESLAKFKYYGPPVLFFLTGIVYAKKMIHLRTFWIITIVIGIFSSLYALNQLYNGYSKAELIWFSTIEFSTLFIKDLARPFSFFQAPVALADYIQIAVIAVLMLVAWKKNRSSYLLYLLIPLLFYTALITSVRTSWIGLLLTFFLWYIFFQIKGNKGRFITLGIITVGILSLQFTFETFNKGINISSFVPILTNSFTNQEYLDLLVSNRLGALYNPFEEHSFLSRLILWKNLIAYSKEPIHAFLGRGVGALKADSLYFTYLAEFGYPGIIFIIALIAHFIMKGFQLIDNVQNHTILILAKGITTMNLVFAFISITGTHIHYFPGDVYFWFWNGVLIRLYSLNKQDISLHNESINEN